MAVSREETSAPAASQYASTDAENFDVDARPAQGFVPPSGVISAGWSAAKSDTKAAGDYPVEFKGTSEAQLVKFIDTDEAIPFANYRQHWLEKSGQRSYVCIGENCPLCKELLDKTETKRAFSIVNLSTTPPQRQMIVASKRFFDAISVSNEGKFGPVTKHYWSITRIGEKASTNYQMQAVKATDLQEDWGLDPAEVEQTVKAFTPYDMSAIRINSLETLKQIAKELSA